MAYARTHVKQALSAAREAGKPVDGLMVGDRETAIMLEKWGYLPIDQAALDKRIQDWYVSQGLAVREGDLGAPRRGDTPDDTPAEVSLVTRDASSDVVSGAALEAAEAALAAASAAIRLVKSIA